MSENCARQPFNLSVQCRSDVTCMQPGISYTLVAEAMCVLQVIFAIFALVVQHSTPLPIERGFYRAEKFVSMLVKFVKFL